jgi:beta-lactamase class A
LRFGPSTLIEMNPENLQRRVAEIGTERNLTAVSVAIHDYESDRSFAIEGGRWFHAASVIKLAVLLAIFKAVEGGVFRLDDPVHVRNRFRSVVDGAVYRVERDRDGDAECHRRVGRTMQIAELSRAMIVRSSNIATNLLVDLLGLEFVRQTLSAAGVEGVRMRRGVEDHAAFERGINNEMTSAGARQILRVMHENGFLRQESRDRIREILLGQEFNAMIPAQLPDKVEVAHKTGEISTHSHDAGLVFPEGRAPYIVAIFTQSEPGVDHRTRAVAEISGAVYAELTT